jgi:spermidine synthase
LAFEVLWQRDLVLILGASASATTAVLTAIMVGIAFGSLLAGRLTKRLQQPLAGFVLMECIIGGWGLCVPEFMPLVREAYIGLAHRVGEGHGLLDVARFGLSVATLLPATVCMGATIPFLVAALSPSRHSKVAIIYGFNTLGAVAGALLTGLVLVRTFGMSQSRFAAAACNGFAAISVWLVMRASRPAGSAAVCSEVIEADQHRPQAADRALLAILYFIAGFIALGLEVVWLRFLGIVNSNATVTFSLTLALYLLAMALGSLVLFPALRTFLRPRQLLTVANLTVAVASLATFHTLFTAPVRNYHKITIPAAAGDLTLTDIIASEAGVIGVLIFLPALLMGLVYPAICHSIEDSERASPAWVGSAYCVGMLGSAAGAAALPLVVIPLIGLHPAFAVLVTLSAVLACISCCYYQTAAWRWPVAALSLLATLWAGWIGLESRPVLREFVSRRTPAGWSEFSVADNSQRISDIRRYRAGSTGTVIIKQNANSDDRLVYVDDQLVASTNMEARVDALMLAHLPLLLHPAPRNELTVGFGSGGTSYAITTHAVDAWCVEIEREVVQSAALLQKQNFGVLQNPRFNLIINDARDHLTITEQSYDVIATDVTNLQYKQNSSLYTVEYFELMRARLNPDGIACAWIPMAAINTFELRVLMRGFQQVFPHATLWYLNHTHTNFGILIGTPSELSIDYDRLAAGMQVPEVAENLKLIGISDPLQVILALHLDEASYRQFCGDVPLHTDNDPLLEFSSPLSFYQYNTTFRDNLSATLALRPEDPSPWVDSMPTAVAMRLDAEAKAATCFCKVVLYFYDFMIHRGQNDRDAAIGSLRQAVLFAEAGMEAQPDDVARERFYVSFFELAESWLAQ